MVTLTKVVSVFVDIEAFGKKVTISPDIGTNCVVIRVGTNYIFDLPIEQLREALDLIEREAVWPK